MRSYKPYLLTGTAIVVVAVLLVAAPLLFATEDLDWMQYGILTARRAWLTRKDVINTLTLKQLLKLLGSIRNG